MRIAILTGGVCAHLNPCIKVITLGSAPGLR